MNYCDECPHKEVRNRHEEMLTSMLQTRLGEEAKHYKTSELQMMVFDVSKFEETDRSKMGAKDSRLLSLYLTEKAKVERQEDASKKR